MKNKLIKLLSYLFGSFISICFSFGYVHAEDCAAQCKDVQDVNNHYVCITKCIQQQDQQQQQTKKECKDGCCGIKLNTNFPGFGNCISYDKEGKNPTNAFPSMMATLTKLIMSIVLVVCFITIIVAGIMRAGAGEDSSKKTKAKKLIERVAITILLLGFSGVILRLVNPNFFG